MAKKKAATTKKRTATTKKKLPDDIGMLDDLIGKLYRSLCIKLGKSGKLGDLLKMIELRRKLAPQDSAQRAFWEMMNRIREESLPHGHGYSKSEMTGKAAAGSSKAVGGTSIRKGAK